MAMKVRYTTFDGEIVSENRSGVMRDYVPDPLGSTAALLDNTQAQTDTFSYWPYGDVRTRSGTSPTPFQYIGTAGYYRDSASLIYIRARTFLSTVGRWITMDPSSIDESTSNVYLYCDASPITETDPSGMAPIPAILGPPMTWPKFKGKCFTKNAITILQQYLGKPACITAIKSNCGANFAALVGRIQFFQSLHCDPGNPTKKPFGSCPLTAKNGCTPVGICINTTVCKGTYPGAHFPPNQAGTLWPHFQATVLLFELGNYCECKSGTDPTTTNERVAHIIQDACSDLSISF